MLTGRIGAHDQIFLDLDIVGAMHQST
jgi:hypothetical protein